MIVRLELIILWHLSKLQFFIVFERAGLDWNNNQRKSLVEENALQLPRTLYSTQRHLLVSSDTRHYQLKHNRHTNESQPHLSVSIICLTFSEVTSSLRFRSNFVDRRDSQWPWSPDWTHWQCSLDLPVWGSAEKRRRNAFWTEKKLNIEVWTFESILIDFSKIYCTFTLPKTCLSTSCVIPCTHIQTRTKL